MMNGRLDVRVQPRQILGVNLVIVFVALQSLGVMFSFGVKWPSAMSEVMKFGSAVGGDGFVFYPECVLPQTFVGHWLGNLVMPLVWTAFALVVGVVGTVAPLSAKGKQMFAGNGTVNVIGTIWTCLYVTVVMRTMAFLMCYDHPMQSKSLEKYPWILCDSDEYNSILPLAIVFLLLYVVGILSALLLITIFAPKKIPTDESYWVKFRFVFLSYRPECYFWKFVHMVRQALCASVGAFAPNDPYLQLILMAFFSLFFEFAVFFFLPWYDSTTNYLDVGVLMVVCFISLLGMTKIDDFTPKADDEQTYDNMQYAALGLFFALGLFCQVLVVKKLLAFAKDEGAQMTESLSQQAKNFCASLDLGGEELKKLLSFANDQDRRAFNHLSGYVNSMQGTGSSRVPRPPQACVIPRKDETKSKEVHV